MCRKHFSVNTTWPDTKTILRDHLDGLSFRKLSSKYHISKSHAWDICNAELAKLPNNNQFTFNFCDRFSTTLVVDGKYFKVKDKKYGYALLWGVDYFTHDIPVFTIAPSENYQSWAKYFSYFRILNQYPQLVVCDDNVNIKMAARARFPLVRIQTCYNHFKENIRRNLKTRSDKTYIPFMRKIESIIDSSHKLSEANYTLWLQALWRDYHHDPVCLEVMTTIQKYTPELRAYEGIKGSPTTTNIIEGFNSHLEARLLPLRSFQSVSHARLWLNGFILKRRLTKWTDCKGKFRYLNGRRGVDMTKKHGIVLPSYF